MIKTSVVNNSRTGERHVYFEASGRENPDDLGTLDEVYQALMEGSDLKKVRGEYVNSYCLRFTVRIPKAKTEPMPDSPPVKQQKVVKTTK